jgi:hypothetical protein
VTPARRRQIAAFREWLPDWLVRSGLVEQHPDAARALP